MHTVAQTGPKIHNVTQTSNPDLKFTAILLLTGMLLECWDFICATMPDSKHPKPNHDRYLLKIHQWL